MQSNIKTSYFFVRCYSRYELIAAFTIDNRILAIIAVWNPIIYEPCAKLNAMDNTAALIISEKNPKLKNVNGKNTNFINGFNVAFKITRINARKNNVLALPIYIVLITRSINQSEATFTKINVINLFISCSFSFANIACLMRLQVPG